MKPRVEVFSSELPQSTRTAVRAASAAKTASRAEMLARAFEDVRAARQLAARVKDQVLDNLKPLLLELEANCLSNGMRVHWAADADSACRQILGICEAAAPKGSVIVKGKSMATEEIHLNSALAEGGYMPVETDLGEYVVQIDDDTPSHIVTPIIHKSRFDVARSFAREGLGPYTEEAEELTMQARSRLRSYFRSAAIGISGVNFAIASTGRLVIVENEGNNRLSTTAPRVHIAVMGIEKLLPTEEHLPTFLQLLAGSGTGQRLTVYVHMISGPRREDEEDGPEEVHLVLLDNGRSKVLSGPYRSILRCIRCGACLNACPVYRQSSGHAYGHVYPGPVGAVLAPALEGLEEHADLPFASSLCGQCEEVCPVAVPIPDMLLQLRNDAKKHGLGHGPPFEPFAAMAANASRWSGALRMLPLASALPNPALSAWTDERAMPEREGDFRRWWRDRS